MPSVLQPRSARGSILVFALALVAAFLSPALVQAQTGQDPGPWPARFRQMGDGLGPDERGTSNLEVVAHVPLGGYIHVADVELEQDLDRPFAYVSKRFHPTGFDVISLEDETDAEVIYRWRMPNSELHTGSGALDGRYFKHEGRYYLVQSFQFGQGGPNRDLGAIVFDVTSLPDTSGVREVGRIEAPETPGGFHNIYMYKHSDGRPLLFTTTRSEMANVYDMAAFLEDGDEEAALVAQLPVPENRYWALTGGNASWHDFYVGYDAGTGQDRFWGGGTGGFFVYDITDLQSPELLVTMVGISGLTWGHTFTPTPDGRFAVGETEHQFAPLRIFDLTPAWEGEQTNIRRPVSGWTANYRNLAHNHEMRWPFVFVAAYEDGFQVFNMMDPHEPMTWAYYDTYPGPHESRGENNVNTGAWGVDIRNADGLIVVSDMVTGFWAFRMEGFEGWNGMDWGMPNISSVQDWDNGPAVQAGTNSSGGTIR